MPAERVGAAFGDELNLHGALRAAVGRQPGGRHRHFLHRAETRRREREDAGAARPEPLGVVVDAVERDVDGAAGKPVDVAVAGGRRRRARRAGGILLRARNEQREHQHAAVAHRQLLDLRVADGRGDRRRRGLDHRGARPRHFTASCTPATSACEADVCRRAAVSTVTVSTTIGWKPLAIAVKRVAAGLHGDKDEATVAGAPGCGADARRLVADLDLGVLHDGAGRIANGADDLTSRAHLRLSMNGTDRHERGDGDDNANVPRQHRSLLRSGNHR